MKIWQNMELKYITYSEQLCKKLAKLGFTRKGIGTFLRRSNGFEQTLGYGHSAHIPHTRDYYIMVGLECLELAKLGMDLGVYTAGVWGVTIGQLTPRNNFQEWHVENSASEEDVRDVVSEMVNLIETYAVPFLDKHSDINEVLYEIEEGNNFFIGDRDYNLPLIYYMIGKKDYAISYLISEMERKESECRFSPYGRIYNQYKDFASKLMARIEQ